MISLSRTNMVILLVGIIVLYVGYKCMTNNSVYEDFNEKSPVDFRMFYVDWCPHCKDAKPDFQKLIDSYGNKTINGYPLNIEMVNAEENSELASDNNVKSYPTIILTKNSVNEVYEGDRTKDAYYNYLNKSLV